MSNFNRIISLALKPGNDYMKEVLTRLVIFASVFFIAVILIIMGIAFLVWSSFLYLSTVLNPYLAALISGLIAIVFAGALVLIVSMLNKGGGAKKTEEKPDGVSMFAGDKELIEQYPLESGLMAMAAGFIAGSSPESRKMLTELFVTLSQSTSE